MLWHSLIIHDHRSANTGSKKLKIREERAIIDQLALTKLAFLIWRTKILKTHEEECCINNLRLKWRRLNKWKGYLYALDDKEKLTFLYGVGRLPKQISENFYWISTTHARFMENSSFLIKNLQKVYKLVNGNHYLFQFEKCWLDSRIKMTRFERASYCFKPSIE